MRCEHTGCNEPVTYTLPPVPGSPVHHLCMAHQLEGRLKKHTEESPVCRHCGHGREARMEGKVLEENRGLWSYVDLLEARLDKIAAALGVEGEYIDSIGPMLEAIDRLKLLEARDNTYEPAEMDYTLEEDEVSF